MRSPERWQRLLAAGLLAGLACSTLPAQGAQDGPAGAQPSREQVKAAADKVRADPLLPQTRQEKTLRFKPQDEKPANQPLPDWLAGLARWLSMARYWFTETARWLVWAVGALAVALLLVSLRYWVRTRAGAGQQALPELPSHVQNLDIRPGSLPEPIGATAALVWQQGQQRAALSLLYRGLLSRMVHQHAVPIRSASTEGECLALASQQLDGVRAELTARLVRAWQSAVYGTQMPESATVLALCGEFDTRFAAAAQPQAAA